MRSRAIGVLAVSEIGLGCTSFGNDWGRRTDEPAARAIMHAALDAGIAFFDTSDSYGDSEEYLGRFLRGRRDSVIVATKFGERRPGLPPAAGASRRWIRTAAERSLRRLGTDYIDLYQLHYPDPNVPVEETLQALDELVSAGKVREIGCSNFTGAQVREAAGAAAATRTRPLASAQIELNLLRQAALADIVPACNALGVAVIPYFPLASGVLTGKYAAAGPAAPESRIAKLRGNLAARVLAPERRAALAEELQLGGVSQATVTLVRSLGSFAAERGHTTAELAVAWLLARQETATVIVGASTPEQVRANALAASWRLTAGEAATAGAIARGEAGLNAAGSQGQEG
jgi:aryl-alcohol dehydrogenase-like predicted oxidoreductase